MSSVQIVQTSTAVPASLKLMPHDTDAEYKFGPWPIAASEVFARTQLSFAFVNLKPLVPGHVLVSPVRPAPRFLELAPDEVADMMLLAQAVAARLEPHYGAAAATVAIQDGSAAGQTVPHVHVHVLPRRPGDFNPNDKVYDEIEAQEKGMAGSYAAATGGGGGGGANGGGGSSGGGGGGVFNLDVERKPRTPEEMAAEAADLRRLFSPA